jgi:DNA-directed RNA polymerase specialized sigma24 family protein
MIKVAALAGYAPDDAEELARWVNVISTRAMRDALRVARSLNGQARGSEAVAHASLDEESEAGRTLHDSLAAADDAHTQTLLRRVCAVLADLPPHQARSVELAVEGYGYPEIAAERGITRSAVCLHMAAARDRLRAHLPC